MRTVQEIFDETIHLIDGQNESTGATLTSDTKEYAFRTPNCLNQILNMAYPYSDTYAARADGKRPTHPAVTSMEDTVDMDDYICMSVLPPGLAARLLVEENPDVASFYQQTFEECLAAAGRNLPAAEGSVEDVYGCTLEYGEFSRWW